MVMDKQTDIQGLRKLFENCPEGWHNLWQAGTRLAKSFSIFEDFFGLKGYKSLILVDHIQVLENEKYTKNLL